jgi:hypothetical protein
LKGRYKYIAPLEIALCYFRGIPYALYGQLRRMKYLTNVHQFHVHVRVRGHVHVRVLSVSVSVSMSVYISMSVSVLFQFKYGAMNINGGRGNNVVDFQGSYEVARKL